MEFVYFKSLKSGSTRNYSNFKFSPKEKNIFIVDNGLLVVINDFHVVYQKIFFASG